MFEVRSIFEIGGLILDIVILVGFYNWFRKIEKDHEYDKKKLISFNDELEKDIETVRRNHSKILDRVFKIEKQISQHDTKISAVEKLDHIFREDIKKDYKHFKNAVSLVEKETKGIKAEIENLKNSISHNVDGIEENNSAISDLEHNLEDSNKEILEKITGLIELMYEIEKKTKSLVACQSDQDTLIESKVLEMHEQVSKKMGESIGSKIEEEVSKYLNVPKKASRSELSKPVPMAVKDSDGNEKDLKIQKKKGKNAKKRESKK